MFLLSVHRSRIIQVKNAANQDLGTYQYFDPFDRMITEAGALAQSGLNDDFKVTAPNWILMAVTMLAEALPASLANLQLGGAARTIELTLPPGAKLAQMIARGGQQFAKNPAGFLSFARDLVSRAADQGTCVFVKGIGGGGGVSVKWWKSLNATSGA